MSLISSFKKALGFPDEYDDEIDGAESDTDDEIIADDTDATTSDDAHTESPTADTASLDKQAENETFAAFPGKIFDSVIELFNATQPEFVRQCLDIESQRNYILQHIDSSLRALLENEAAAARLRGEKQWLAERQRMSSDLDKLKAEYNTLRQQREEFQSAQLSAARQKRALSERVHDLENQVNTLEAEKEQYQLENRSMQNKLRVANLRGNGNEDTEAQILRMAEENTTLQESLTKITADLKNAKETIEQLQQALEKRPEETDTAALREEQEAAIAEIEAQIKQFEQIKKKKDAKIAELQSAAKRSSTHIAQIELQLNERDTTINKLKAETESLRKTIQDNLYAQATAESELKQEIERLKELVNASQTAPAKPKKHKQHNKSRNEIVENNAAGSSTADNQQPSADDASKNTVKISAIDELMDSTDWFVAPEPVPLKKAPEVEEDFGYKEPVKKTSRDDDKQLSLW